MRYVIFNGVRTRYEDDGSQDTLDTPQTQLFEYDGSGNLHYQGKAQPGAATSDPAWQIRQFTYVAGNLTAVQYANGSPDYAAAWDSRAALTYS